MYIKTASHTLFWSQTETFPCAMDSEATTNYATINFYSFIQKAFESVSKSTVMISSLTDIDMKMIM